MKNPAEEISPPTELPSTSLANTKWKWTLAAILVALLGLCYYQYQEQLSLEELVRHEKQLYALKESQPLLVYGGAFLLYVAVTGSSFPAATVLTLLYAKFFGFWHALVLVSFASTAGATIAFLLSRYLLRDVIQDKFGERLTGFNRALEREGAFYLFTLRLLPVVPFFVINLVMGLTPIRTATFWWVSQVGMFAGSVVYVYTGTTLPGPKEIIEQGAGSVLTLPLLVALVALGLFPLVTKKIVGYVRRPQIEAEV